MMNRLLSLIYLLAFLNADAQQSLENDPLIKSGISQAANTNKNFFLQPSYLGKHLSGAAQLQLFVKGNEKAVRAAVKQAGGKVKYTFGNYYAISIPSSPSNLKLLNEFNGISRIEFSHQHAVALNDSMRVKTFVNPVQQGASPLPQGYKGKNIIIGFIDTGIDFNHPDFQDSTGNTRVLAIWDQTQGFDALRTPPKYGYGQVWDSTDINNGICTSVDGGFGHGTTVAGTAAGNGLSTGTHWGAAPESWLVMVRSNFNAPNWSATVADAVDYMYHLADSLDMPCVINISAGDYMGSHDGKDVSALFIDSLVRAKRGRLLVCAGGNSGEMGKYHLTHTVTGDTTFTWFEYNSGSALGYGSVFFEVWADTADMNQLRFSMGADQVSPVFKERGKSGFYKVTDMLGTILTDTVLSPQGNILGFVDYYSELQGDRYLLQVHMNEPDSIQYYFRFQSTGTGSWDTWTASWLGISDMVPNGLPTSAVFPDIAKYTMPDSLKTIVSGFNCLPSVITVANYNNIQNYNGYNGVPVSLPGIEGSIAASSSRGPTRDNRIKPEVAATGNVTFSPGPLSLLATYIASFPERLLQDGMHMRNGGTSIASPVVAGIGAMMLERCPYLRWDEFADAINGSGFADGFTGTLPNNSFGYGKVNAFDAIMNTVYTPVIGGNYSFCENDNAMLNAPSNFVSYEWSTGDTTSTIIVDSTQNITLYVTDSAGCRSLGQTVSIIENPLPVANFSNAGNTLTATPSGAAAYQWMLDGNSISGAGNVTYTITQSGNYSVSVTDANGCVGTSPVIFVNYVGMDESLTGLLQVFPNPFSDELYIENNSGQTGRFAMNDISGKLMEEGTVENYRTRISLTSIAPGIYFLNVQIGNNTAVIKVEKLN